MQIKLAKFGQYEAYESSFLPLLIQSLGYQIHWVDPDRCDLLIKGSFKKVRPSFKWLPRPMRKPADHLANTFFSNHRPLTLFHTSENIRNDQFDADYFLSFDLPLSNNQFRLPFWMEFLDWSHEGLKGNANPRFGRLLSIDELSRPLGDAFLRREKKAVIFSSHLRDPRKVLYKGLSAFLPVEGMGPFFDQTIIDHNHSGFTKESILKNYAFNLCPENGLHPGYYTEKIPEAFSAGTLPISWTDSNVQMDFNPKAFVNLQPFAYEGYQTPFRNLCEPHYLNSFCDQPLLLSTPSIEPLKKFMGEILRLATS
jgi:hypothetical protein